MTKIYDNFGVEYAAVRKSDHIIEGQIFRYIENAECILNIGAGTGSYEPRNMSVIALEPSISMIKQRPNGRHLAVQGLAESLPFANRSFSQVLTVLSMHHWLNRTKAFQEVKRVVSRRFIAVTWDPESNPYWLTEDYFPEIHQIDQHIFPSLVELSQAFPGINFFPILIPSKCSDGFTAAYWARPEAYLNHKLRRGMSTFARIQHLQSGLERLERDLSSGAWYGKYGDLIGLDEIDVGYKLAVWEAPQMSV